MTRPTAAATPLQGSDADATGLILRLRQLDWDTDFFGARMGAIGQTPGRAPASAGDSEELGRALRDLLQEARRGTYAHVILRVPAEDLPLAWAAERAGFNLVDIGVDSSFSIESTPPPEPDAPFLIRDAETRDLPTLREIAGRAFVFSRFAADPFFSREQVIAFHEQWIANLCAGLARVVRVCEDEGRVIGFVSCALDDDEGRIPLIATDGRARRRGVGRALIADALRWFSAEGARVVYVKTQANNYPALALYHRAGFVVSKTELTFSAAPGAAAVQER